MLKVEVEVDYMTEVELRNLLASMNVDSGAQERGLNLNLKQV